MQNDQLPSQNQPLDNESGTPTGRKDSRKALFALVAVIVGAVVAGVCIYFATTSTKPANSANKNTDSSNTALAPSSKQGKEGQVAKCEPIAVGSMNDKAGQLKAVEKYVAAMKARDQKCVDSLTTEQVKQEQLEKYNLQSGGSWATVEHKVGEYKALTDADQIRQLPTPLVESNFTAMVSGSQEAITVYTNIDGTMKELIRINFTPVGDKMLVSSLSVAFEKA